MNKLTDDQFAERAKAMAEGLAKAGIVNDPQDAPPDPRLAAREAFLRVHGRQAIKDLIEMKKDVKAGRMPRQVLERKLANVCRKSLRHGLVSEDLVESVTYAWGYFNARLEKNGAQSEGRNDTSS